MIQYEYDEKIEYIMTYVKDCGTISIDGYTPKIYAIQKQEHKYLMYISTDRRNIRCEAIFTTKIFQGKEYPETELIIDNKPFPERASKGDKWLLQSIYDAVREREIAKELFEF